MERPLNRHAIRFLALALLRLASLEGPRSPDPAPSGTSRSLPGGERGQGNPRQDERAPRRDGQEARAHHHAGAGSHPIGAVLDRGPEEDDLERARR